MDSVKAFFAKDVVKLVMGALFMVAAGLVTMYVKDENMKVTILGIIAGVGSFLGIQSGGTSGLRSNASNSVTAQLQDRGVVQVGNKPPQG